MKAHLQLLVLVCCLLAQDGKLPLEFSLQEGKFAGKEWSGEVKPSEGMAAL